MDLTQHRFLHEAHRGKHYSVGALTWEMTEDLFKTIDTLQAELDAAKKDSAHWQDMGMQIQHSLTASQESERRMAEALEKLQNELNRDPAMDRQNVCMGCRRILMPIIKQAPPLAPGR